LRNKTATRKKEANIVAIVLNERFVLFFLFFGLGLVNYVLTVVQSYNDGQLTYRVFG